MENSKYYSSEDLIRRWSIRPFDLLQKVRECEIPFNSDGVCDIAPLMRMDELETLYFAEKDVADFEEQHPDLKPQKSPYISKDGEIPPYLEADHKYFSEELSIAVETWLAMYGPAGNLKTKTGPKKPIMDYLEKHHKNLSKSAMERIATIVNPQKQGGAPIIG